MGQTIAITYRRPPSLESLPARGLIQEDFMLRIVLFLAVVLVLIALVPRLLSRSATPSEGAHAPDFTLPSQEASPVSLRDYRGKWVVLYFYPKDQTPGCSREAHNFQVDGSKYI